MTHVPHSSYEAMTHNWNELTKCNHGACPTVFLNDSADELIVQGYVTDEIVTPDGETAVRIPRAVFQQAAVRLDERSDRGKD